MKFEINLKEFKKIINSISRIASSKTSLPILANLLIKADQNTIIISATDLELGLEVKINTAVTNPSSIIVPARILNDLVTNLPDDDDIKIEVKNNKLFIHTKNNETYINCSQSNDFPDLPTIEGAKQIKLNAVELKDALIKTSFVASRDETRPVLNGCLLKFNQDKLFIVATDGYRLAEKTISLESGMSEDLIIPTNTIQELIKIITNYDDIEELQVCFDDTSIKFNISSIELTSRIIDGKYPDYKQIIPSDFTVKTKLKKSEFSGSIKLASLFAKESAGSITISFDSSDQFISIKSDSSQVGENNSQVKVDEAVGEGKTTINARYIGDALNVIDTSAVEFNYSEGVMPCLIKPVGDDSYVHIIMPLKS
jgi:DNA polymerase-3 subunit beta